MVTYKSIWDTLSALNVSEHTEKKGNLTYLSWAWAWGTLMSHYPQAEYSVRAEKFFPDGSCEVGVDIDILECKRSMWLPVMDGKNNAIQSPSATDINKAKMRCLAKCIAMFGLGHYIYAGEDLPEPVSTPKDAAAAKNGHATNEQRERIVALLDSKALDEKLRPGIISRVGAPTYPAAKADECIAYLEELPDATLALSLEEQADGLPF